MNRNKNSKYRDFKTRLALLATTVTVALGSNGCANIQKQNEPVVQSGETRDEIIRADAEELTFEQLYEQLDQDRELFRRKNYSNMTREEKIEAERKAKRDMSNLLCTNIANAITEGTGKECDANDVRLDFFIIYHDNGFTWTGEENIYTEKGLFGKGNIICREISEPIAAYSRACRTAHFDIMDGITLTYRQDLIGNQTDEEHIRRNFDIAIDRVLHFTKCHDLKFDGNEFSVVPVKETEEQKDITKKADAVSNGKENKTKKEFEVFNEEEKSLDNLLEKLKEDELMFQSPEVYSAMGLNNQTALEEETLYDMGMLLREYLANAITKGTGEEYSYKDIDLFYSLRADNGGVVLKGSDCTYTKTGFKNKDKLIPNEIADVIERMAWVARVRHYSNKNGIAVTWRIGVNEEDEKVIRKNFSRAIEDVIGLLEKYNCRFDGEEFQIEPRETDRNNDEER